MSGSHNSHSVLSPSSASRWTTCTASVPFTQLNGMKGKDSRESSEGTHAHDLAEAILTGKLDSPPEGFEELMDYIDLCRTLKNRWGGCEFVEEKVPLFYMPVNTGTVDFALICVNRICIVDLKWGVGVPVSAVKNKQLAIYAQSFIADIQYFYGFPDDTPVDIFISQPRCTHEDAGGCWNTSVGELRKFCETEILPAVEQIERAFGAIEANQDFLREAQFRPSIEACRWCPAKQNGKCVHRMTQAFAPLLPDSSDALELLEVLPDTEITPVIPDMRMVSDHQLLSIYLRIPEIESAVSGVKQTILSRAVGGNPVPGTKLVEGRKGNTAWIDQGGALDQLSSLFPSDATLIEMNLKSPAQITKMAGKDEAILQKIKELTTRAPGRPTVALESDKRPAITASVDLLEVLDDEN